MLRLVLMQRVTLQPLVTHQISLLKGHTTFKSSQNKRITVVGMKTVSMPFTMNILLHSPHYINNTPVEMEVNTGAAVSIINDATFQ